MLLNRLDITGDIDEYTPKIVLEEIADSFGIKYKDLDHQILKNKINIKIEKRGNCITEDYQDIHSLRIISRYVNSKCKNWQKESLIKAFIFLDSFKNFKIHNFQNRNFCTGLQTPENTNSLNACVLYRICKEFHLSVNYYNSLEILSRNVKIYLNLENPHFLTDIKLKIYNEIRLNNDSNLLINIFNTINKDNINFVDSIISDRENIQDRLQKNKKVYKYEDYNTCINNLSEENRKPKNELEAVVMAAIYNKIDISSCEYPLIEYELINKNPVYFPYDPNLIQRMKETYLHPESMLNPFLDKYFNPNFPENMYNPLDIERLISEEGLPNSDTNYSTLQICYLTETFIHGKQGKISNSQTTFLEDISELEYDEIVIYGVRNNQNRTSFRAYTYAELTDTFSHHKRFLDPITNNIFTEDNINKLYLLTKKDRRNTESEKSYKMRLDLSEEIERIKIYISTKNIYVEKFIEKYENLDDVGKTKLEQCLKNLLNCSMYMRNWDGVSDYPLTSQATNFENNKQILIDHRVTQSLIEFQESCKELIPYNKLNVFFLNLPLMKYHRPSNSFITNNDQSEGLTIKERLCIVRKGEEEGENSCIRLSSNRFLATSYYYMILLGFRLPFSIGEVSEIF